MKSKIFTRLHLLPWILFFLFSSCEKIDTPSDGNSDQSPFAVEIGTSKIPYITIDTEGKSIEYEPGIPAKLKIFENKELVQEQKIDIEYRGKTSFRLSDKKGFNFESIDAAGEGMDVSFLGLPKEEDWRLIGHVVNFNDKYIFDRTMIYNVVGYELSRLIGKYAARTKIVELEVNKEYMGVYVLTEKLKRDSERIDIKSLNATSTNLTGGYILTIDKVSIGDAGIGKPLSYFLNNWDDDARYVEFNSFRSKYDINRNLISFAPYGAPYHPNQFLETYFLYEYPKDKDITPAQKEYIAKYIHDFETALIQDDFGSDKRTYTNYIDVASFVDYFLINELCRNVDAYRISTYLQKDRDGKLKMGPVWDMNIAFDEGGRVPMNDWVINYNKFVNNDAWMLPFWWNRLMEDPSFRQAVKQRWTSIRGDQWTDAKILKLVDDNAQYLKENGAVQRNYTKWDKNIGVNYDQSINSLKNFLKDRAAWMDKEIAKF